MKELNQSNRLFINKAFFAGAWRDALTTECIAVYNPATQLAIGSVPNCGKVETQQAIDAARQISPGWSSQTAGERCRLLRSWFEAILRNKSELAEILTSEQGKPLAEAEREIIYGASFIDWFAEEGRRIYGETVPAPTPDRRILVLKQPIGVCAAITPWNFPNAMITRKAAAALAAGCVMIIKPAPETPFSALALVKLALEAGIPANVLQVVTGDAEPIADAFMESPLVRKLSFTGSTEVGKILIRRSAETIKRLTLELGGNAPFIVFEDADLEKAVQGALFAKYRNAGQTCICVNRFLVHEKVSDQFAQRLHEATAKLKVGNGHDEGVEVGPLINAESKAKVMRLLADAKDRGAKSYSKDSQELGGLYCQPTVLTGVTPQMAIWQEEIFGPIASITNFKDEEHLLELAHNTEAGLAAYVYTRDLSRAWRVCEALEYGMVGLNDALISAPQAPFGGVKESGYGREGGHQGIEEYLHLKYISIAL